MTRSTPQARARRFMPAESPDPQSVISVSELNRLARLALERTLPSCWVVGEISNLSRPSSGHWYFTLKDAQASARCAMFRARNQFVSWIPRDGERVELRAQPTLYEARGDFQLLVDAMRQAGQGSLFEAFLKLKAKLESEGLFSAERKRPLPRFPRTIGIITSPHAAALRDALSTLRKRWPGARVVLYPSPVQGHPAAEALKQALALAQERNECDVLLLIRGGGSLEDLQAYNHEGLARAIAASSIALISGVGHETDFCIADFVADLRAPTPTGAAQSACPDAREIAQHVAHLAARVARVQRGTLRAAAQRLDGLAQRLQKPSQRLAARSAHLDGLRASLATAFQARQRHARHRLELARNTLKHHAPAVGAAQQRLHNLSVRLNAGFMRQHLAQRQRYARSSSALQLLNPRAVLDRGYAIVRDASGKLLTSVRDVAIDDGIDISLAQGALRATVREKLD